MASKTTTVNINGAIFHMTEVAYKLFSDYLKSVKKYFNKHEGKEEIVSDLESRMAEHFNERLSPGKQVMLKSDVEELIEIMGHVEDFAAEEEGREGSKPKVSKRFYRDPENRILAGVCAGLANYFEVDVRLVRLIFFIAIFFGGIGILAYGLLWIFVPEAKTTAEKEEMAGYKFDLAGIAKDVEEKVKDIKVPKKFGQGIGKFFKALGQGVTWLVKFILKFILLTFQIVTIFATPALILVMVALTFVVVLVPFDLHSQFIHLPLDALGNKTSFYLFLYGIYLSILSILAGLLFIFLSPLKKKWLLSAGKAVLLISLFLIGGLVAFLAALDLNSRVERMVRQGISHQNLVSETFDSLESFDSLFIRQPLTQVEVIQGENYSLELKTGELCQGLFEPTIEKNTLLVRKKDFFPLSPFCQSWGAQAVITMPSLDYFRGSDFSINTIQGFDFQELEIHLSDGAKLNLEEGTAENLIANLHWWSSKLYASDFPVKNATIETHGSSEAQLWVTEALDARAYDESYIRYRGEPEIVDNYDPALEHKMEHINAKGLIQIDEKEVESEKEPFEDEDFLEGVVTSSDQSSVASSQ